MEAIAADESAVSAQQEDTRVSQDAPNSNDIVQVRTGHLDVSKRNKIMMFTQGEQKATLQLQNLIHFCFVANCSVSTSQ